MLDMPTTPGASNARIEMHAGRVLLQVLQSGEHQITLKADKRPATTARSPDRVHGFFPSWLRGQGQRHSAQGIERHQDLGQAVAAPEFKGIRRQAQLQSPLQGQTPLEQRKERQAIKAKLATELGGVSITPQTPPHPLPGVKAVREPKFQPWRISDGKEVEHRIGGGRSCGKELRKGAAEVPSTDRPAPTLPLK